MVDPETGEERTRMQIVGAFGGYGSGKSKSSLTEVLIRALENPGGTGLLTAPTLQQLKRTTLKTFFQEICPPPLIENYNKTDGEIRLINGFTFFTIPSDDEEKLRSINAGLIHMEEASGIKRTIFDQLLTRMRDPFVKNRMFMVCSNPDLGWIKEVLVDNDARKDPKHPEHEDYNPAITVFVWPTHLNKHLPPDFIEINSKGKPEWWIKRYLLGSFEHSEGMVYPSFANTFVDSSEYGPIPAHWERFVTLDHGLRNPTAVYFHAINPDKGEVVTYDEYYFPNRLVPAHAQALKPMIEEIPLGRLRFMVADPSIKNKTDPVNGKSVQGLYQEYGLFFQPGNNSIETGILRVNSYIERGKWKIFRDKCPNLCREGIGYKFPDLSMDDADENLDEKPVKKNDHAMDSVRYGFMRLPDDPDLLATDAFEPGKYKRTDKDRNRDWEDEDDDLMAEHAGRDWTSYV
jgi:PBSX family phage terminase large subunit